MRRYRFTPYDVRLASAKPGEFILEFSVETKPYEKTGARVFLTMPRYWGSAIVDKIMEMVRREEAAVKTLRDEIKAEANR